MKLLPPSLLLGFAASCALLVPAFSADAPPAATPAPKPAARPQPPTRPFDAPGAPKFTRLDGKPGVNPPADADGDFVIGPDYVPAPEFKVVEGVPQGKVRAVQHRLEGDANFSTPASRGTSSAPSIRTTPRR